MGIMNTFYIIHVVVGLWLIVSNYTRMLQPTSLMWNNIIIGIIIAVYSGYYLLFGGEVEIRDRS